jgi:hypothetical protein
MLGGWLAATVAGANMTEVGAQTSQGESSLIESRQTELRQLARMLYGVRLDRGTWEHHAMPVCPVFSHHLFARYDLLIGDRLAESFLAVYALDRGPATSMQRPWEGGIVLVPLYGAHGGSHEPAAARAETIGDFNAVWRDERQRSGHPDNFPGLSWSGLADCYLRFAGEQPEGASTEDAEEAGSINLKGELVSGVAVPLTARGANTRSGSVQFDKRGLVTSAAIFESATLR